MGQFTHNTALVLIPPQDLWPPIQAIRQQHDRKIRRWMPHVTLIYPFWPRDRFEEAVERITLTCEQMRTFSMKLATFSTFHHGRERYTMWLSPQPAQAIVDLYTALVATLAPGGGGPQFRARFVPHLSVGQVQGKARMEELMAALKATWRPVRWDISEVSLIWRHDSPDDVFRVEQTILLEGSKPNKPSDSAHYTSR